jgi:hypothetical protein
MVGRCGGDDRIGRGRGTVGAFDGIAVVIRIATYAHRYKRPPGKRKAVALEVPAVITAASKRRRVSNQGHRCLNAAFVPCRPARPGRRIVLRAG